MKSEAAPDEGCDEQSDRRGKAAKTKVAPRGALQQDGEEDGKRYWSRGNVGVEGVDGSELKVTVVVNDYAPKFDCDGQRTENHEAIALHEDEERGQKEIEVFFDGEGPEVTCVPGILNRTQGKVVTDEENGGEEVMRSARERSQGHQESDGREIKQGCGLNATEAADIEAAEIEFALQALLLQQTRSDEQATDGEEEIHSAVSAVVAEP